MNPDEDGTLIIPSKSQTLTISTPNIPPVNNSQSLEVSNPSTILRKLSRTDQLKQDGSRRFSNISITSTIPPDENIDDILTTIGMGRWQIPSIISICLTKAFCPPLFLGSVFTNMPVNFDCNNFTTNSTYQPEFDNFTTNSTYQPEFDNFCPSTDLLLPNNSDNLCNKPIFDVSVFGSTFTSEFGLICDHQWLSSWFQFSFTVGLCIGSTLIGLSDKNGRMLMLRYGVIGCLIGSLLVCLAPQMILVLVGRFLQGVFIPVTNVSGYALALESTPPEHRTRVGYLIWVPYSLSQMLVGISSYLLREWRTLQLIIYIPIYLNAILLLFLDESPRWLVQHGQINQGIEIMKRAAKLNGVVLSQTILIPVYNKAFQDESHHKDRKSKPGLLISAFSSTKISAMRIIWTIPHIICFFEAIVYFGVPFNANNFTDNPYLYMIVTGAATFPPTVLSDILVRKIGMITTLVITFTITGLCMVSTLGVTDELDWLKWILVGVSMMSICMANNTCDYMIFCFFPTMFRTMGFSMMFVLFYMGSQAGKFLIGPTFSSKWWSFNVICGLCCFICVCLSLTLPEVQSEPLCDTVEEVNQRDIRIKENSLPISSCFNRKSKKFKEDSKGITMNQC